LTATFASSIVVSSFFIALEALCRPLVTSPRQAS
jgi:hypothetical protein